MNTKDAAKILEEISKLLEILDENPFRVRAFAGAARIVDAWPSSLPALLEQAAAGKVKGLGPQITGTLSALLETNSHPLLEELRARVPAGLLELLAVSGLGPKKAKLLFHEHGIQSLQALIDACKNDRLAKISGFGAKSAENIYQAALHVMEYRRFALYVFAQRRAEALLDLLSTVPGVVRVECAGEFRRVREIISCVDFLVAGSSQAAVSRKLQETPGVVEITDLAPDTLHIRFATSPAARIHFSSEQHFALRWLELSASEEHFAALQQRAAAKNIRLGEQKTEVEIYQALGCAYVPVPLRESSEEVAIAADLQNTGRSYPPPLRLSDIRGILHAHTTYSDGVETLRDFGIHCKEQGYQYFGVCDHSPTAIYANGLSAERVRAQHQEIDRLNKELAPFRIFKGIESDILRDGSLDYPDEVLATFDFIVASVHRDMNIPEEEMTERVCRALRNPFTTILGHPTGRLLLRREGYGIDIERILQVAAENGVAIELNTNPRRLDLDWRWIRKAKELGVNIPINPDAHARKDLHYIEPALLFATKGGLEPKDVLSCWDLNRVEKFFENKKARRR